MGIFNNEASVFFIGGLGTKVGNTNAGGCTEEFFENGGGESSFDMSTIMGANGEPIGISFASSYADSTGVITASTPGDFANVETGMVAYIVDGGTVAFTTERYKVTKIDDDTLSIDPGFGTTETDNVNVYVGGAFNTIVGAATDTDATAFNCTVYTNKPEDLASPITVWPSGTQALNTFWACIGFNTQMNDMCIGGTYYQDIYDAFQYGINESKIVAWDRNGANVVADFGAGENRKLRNIGFKDASTETIEWSGTPEGMFFDHCYFYIGRRLMSPVGEANNLHVNDCYFKQTSTAAGIALAGEGSGSFFTSNIIEATSTNRAMAVIRSGDISGCVKGNLIYSVAGSNSSIGLQCSSGFDCSNNTFYGFPGTAVQVLGDIFVGKKNIFMLALKTTSKAIGITSTGGSVVNDSNCIWAIDGEPTENQAFQTDKVGGTAPSLDINSIIANPQFVDPENKDFTPTNPNVIDAGMGAVQPESVADKSWRSCDGFHYK